jgi:hypothetical protein
MGWTATTHMPTTFDKLNLKGQKQIVVLNAPRSFEPELARLDGVTVLRTAHDPRAIEFVLAFVTTQKEVDALARAMVGKTKGDVVVWFAYPKGTAKNYRCEINRDSGWNALGKAGFEAVRMVAIDEDWSAKRYRRVEFIKTMSRDKSHAMTTRGKERATGK